MQTSNKPSLNRSQSQLLVRDVILDNDTLLEIRAQIASDVSQIIFDRIEALNYDQDTKYDIAVKTAERWANYLLKMNEYFETDLDVALEEKFLENDPSFGNED